MAAGFGRRQARAPRLFSLGGALVALLALALARLLHAAGPPADPAALCPAGLPPFVVSLSEDLPPPLAPTPAAAAATAVAAPPASPASAALATPPSATPTLAAGPPLRTLLRADDPPAAHGLRLTSGPPLPLVIPEPCPASESARRGVSPCVKLLLPGDRLCAAGVVGAGRLAAAPDAPGFALQAARVTLTDSSGASRVDATQGYFRYDDPEHGLHLFCPDVPSSEAVGPNARRIIALCRNAGAEGWAVSGQVTDGAGAAPDSISLTVDAPDGARTAIVGSLAAGAIVVREGP